MKCEVHSANTFLIFFLLFINKQGTQNVQVVLGAHQLTANEPLQHRQTVLPAGYRIHENYNTANLNNDIAILILPAAATLTPQIQVATMPALTNTELFTGELATVSG